MKKKEKKGNIHDKEFDTALRTALSELHQEKAEEPSSEEEHHFSKQFEHRIMNLYERYHNQFIPHTNHKIKKSWVLAAALIFVMILTVNAGASRFGRTRFTVGNHDDHSEVNYEVPNMELAPKEILEKREPEWGEEYEEVGRTESKTSITVRMEKKDSDIQIIFSQTILLLSKPYINTEFADLEKELLELKDGKFAYLLIGTDTPYLFWNDGEYYYSLEGMCEKNELLQLANSTLKP